MYVVNEAVNRIKSNQFTECCQATFMASNKITISDMTGWLCTFNSCNMGTGVLPDMYTRSLRAAGPRDEGVHIRQNTSAHVATTMYHFNCEWVNICSNLRQSLHLYTEAW